MQNGKITELRDFALECARAFGACVMLRDEPDKPIPDKFDTDTSYHDKKIAEAEDKMSNAQKMSDAECEEQAEAEFEEEASEYHKLVLECEEQRLRYKRMLEKVRAWNPPTDGHVGLRDFMEKQLEDSIDFDCKVYRDGPVRVTGAAWREEEMRSASRSMDYHREEREKDKKRTKERNDWLKSLRQSLR